MPLSELTKTLKIIDYAFADGNGVPVLGKVSLGTHDSFDHLVLFDMMKRKGLFDKDAGGRGYADFLKEIGSPDKKDIFNRESELLASVAYEWRAFSIMPKEYDPPVALTDIQGYLKNPCNANQKSALQYVDDLLIRDPHGKSDEAKLLRHLFSAVERELKEQERQTGLTLVRPDFNAPAGGRLEQISTAHPEYAALIADLTKLLGDPHKADSPFRKIMLDRNLLYEDYLQQIAQGKEGRKLVAPTPEMIEEVQSGNLVTPQSTRDWMARNPGFNTRRAALRKAS